MNWNELLRKDVGTVLRGGKAPHQAYDRREQFWPGPRYFRKRAQLNDLLAVLSQLAAIVRCNAPMMEGLDAAKVDAPNSKISAILSALRDDIASGLSLAEAMARRPRFFPNHYVDLVAAGERTGQLYGSLVAVSEHLVESRDFRDVLAGYFAYLGGVFLIQLSIIFFLCVYALPQFAAIYTDLDSDLLVTPSWTLQFILAISEFVRFKWPFVLIGISVVIIGVKVILFVARRVTGTQYATGVLLSRIPVLGSLFTKFHLSHLASVLEKLLAGGVPIDTALESAARAHINPLYAEMIQRVKTRVENGEALSSAFGKETDLPASFRGFVSLGDSSGLLPETLAWVSALYRRQAMKTATIVMDVVTPLGIVALGLLTFLFNSSVFAVLIGIVDSMFYAM